MKRIILSLCLFLTMMVAAFAKVDKGVVTMVSYEQGCFDIEATLALKNNGKNVLKKVSFRLTYLDMGGHPLDYRDFTRNVRIEPGMVKRVDVDAYEHRRYYSYYKSENLGYPKFKVKFELLNVVPPELSNAASPDLPNAASPEKEEGVTKVVEENLVVESLPGSSSWLSEELEAWLKVSICVVSYLIVFAMAQSRKRKVVLWLLVSLLITPWMSMALLLALGTKKQYEIRG